MKDYEKILKALECCAGQSNSRCDECPYIDNCRQKDSDARALILELKAQLEQPVNAGVEHAVMPNYEVEYNRLHCENSQLHIEHAEMREELIYLRAVKATAEAFLGREIK